MVTAVPGRRSQDKAEEDCLRKEEPFVDPREVFILKPGVLNGGPVPFDRLVQVQTEPQGRSPRCIFGTLVGPIPGEPVAYPVTRDSLQDSVRGVPRAHETVSRCTEGPVRNLPEMPLNGSGPK